MILIEGSDRVRLAGRAELVEEGRELAWAEKYVRHQPDLAWVLGNFVCADTANHNGHIFPLEDLREAHRNIPNKPLNLLHRGQQIVGVFAGAELLFPTTGVLEDANVLAEAAAAPTVPYVEALAAFYRYYFPETYEAIQAAHGEGSLYFSMEAVPKSLTCAGTRDGAPGCSKEFAYRGRQHETYCAHLNGPGARKVMNKPLFTAGALVLPPARPGWKDADITGLTALLESSLGPDAERELELAYRQTVDEFPHLGPSQWESMMALLTSDLVDASNHSEDRR